MNKFSGHTEPYHHETTIRTIKRQLKRPTINSVDEYADSLNAAEPQNAEETRDGRSLNGGDGGREASAGDLERGDSSDPNRTRPNRDASLPGEDANSGNLNGDQAASHQYLGRRRPLNRDQHSNNFGGSKDDDNEGSFINNLNKEHHGEEDNLINSAPTEDRPTGPTGDAAPGTIRHWNEADSEPLFERKANEQSDSTDEQQEDEENYRINRKTVFYRARL